MVGTQKVLTLLLLPLLPALSSAAEWSAQLEAEYRNFYQSPDYRQSYSGALLLNFTQPLRGANTQLAGELFLRKDSEDSERTHGDVRELYYEAIGPDFEFRAGNRRVYWGVTEGRHLVDIINQSDFVEDLSNEAKLGQPMLSLSLIRDWGATEMFLMPYFRERTFPGPRGHPQLPFPLDATDARYQSPRGRHHLDAALRYRRSFGALDLGLAYFDGTSREPEILPCLRQGSDFQGTEEQHNCDIFSGIVIPQSPFPEALTEAIQQAGLAPSDEEVEADLRQQVIDNLVLVPYYERLRQLSLDAQWVIEAWALKLETLTRYRGGRYSWAAVGGFEYTLGDVGGSGWDLGLLSEYLHDEDADLVSSRYDQEIFFGLRLGLNDIAGSQLLAGGLVDRNGDGEAYQLEASGRLTDSLKLTLKWRVFAGSGDDPLFDFLEREDLLSLKLHYYY